MQPTSSLKKQGEELAGDRIRKGGGHYVDPIQGRVLSEILMELKEEDTPRVMVQQETELLVP